VAKGFSVFLPLSILIYTLGQSIFIGGLSNGMNEYIQFPLYFAIAFFVLPFKKCFNTVDRIGDYSNPEILYKDHFDNKITEYEKRNPVTFGRSGGSREDSVSDGSKGEGFALISAFNNE